MTAAARRPVIVIPGPPTSNGDLHVGHLAGPYIGSDVHVRYLRAAGRDVTFACCTDDSQTYLVTSAAKHGITAPELVRRSTGQIQQTLASVGVELDGFSPTDDGYRQAVYDYVNRLHALGKFELRTVRLPYSEATGTFLVEGFVGGGCPVCLADTRGAFCEGCGHPVDFDALVEPRSILDPDDPVTYRETEILVFPVERYREQLTAYFATKATAWRPHVTQLMRELLARPLPDFAVTYPVAWGLPAPFPETPGQVLNAWIEGMPASMYCTSWAQRRTGRDVPSYDHAWRVEQGASTVVFMGYDPLWFWALVHVAELMAHGDRYVLPDVFLVNEFYELENRKFSTSLGHVVWGRDLVAQVPRDLVRFYLDLTAPEYARTNFSRGALDEVVAQRLVAPWNELAATLGKLVAEAGLTGTAPAAEPLPVPAGTAELVATMIDRFTPNYELATFNLSRAADAVVAHIARLRDSAVRVRSAELDPDALRPALGGLFLQLRALVSCVSPILIDLTARACAAGGFAPCFSADSYRVAHTTAFAVPVLDPHPSPEHLVSR